MKKKVIIDTVSGPVSVDYDEMQQSVGVSDRPQADVVGNTDSNIQTDENVVKIPRTRKGKVISVKKPNRMSNPGLQVELNEVRNAVDAAAANLDAHKSYDDPLHDSAWNEYSRLNDRLLDLQAEYLEREEKIQTAARSRLNARKTSTPASSTVANEVTQSDTEGATSSREKIQTVARNRGRPQLSDEERARRAAEKAAQPRNPRGRPRLSDEERAVRASERASGVRRRRVVVGSINDIPGMAQPEEPSLPGEQSEELAPNHDMWEAADMAVFNRPMGRKTKKIGKYIAKRSRDFDKTLGRGVKNLTTFGSLPKYIPPNFDFDVSGSYKPLEYDNLGDPYFRKSGYKPLDFTPDTWKTYNTYEKTTFKPLQFRPDTWQSYKDLYDTPEKYKPLSYVSKPWVSTIDRPHYSYITGFVHGVDVGGAKVKREPSGRIPGEIDTGTADGAASEEGIARFIGGGRGSRLFGGGMYESLYGSTKNRKVNDDSVSGLMTSNKPKKYKGDALSFLGGSFRGKEDKNMFLDYENMKSETAKVDYTPMGDTYQSPVYESAADILFGAPRESESVLNAPTLKSTGIGDKLFKSEQEVIPFVQENNNESFFGKYKSPEYKSIKDVVATTGVQRRMFGEPRSPRNIRRKVKQPGIIL